MDRPRPSGGEVPRIFHIFEDNASGARDTPFGRAGNLFRDRFLEAVWVKKRNEEIASNWFSQEVVDLIVVLKGKLKIEYAQKIFPPALRNRKT
jgi:hypothetical protein